MLVPTLFFLFSVVFSVDYPLLPEEYVCNSLQKKWNANGNNVNHTYSGMWYSSYKYNKIRSDGTFGDTNHTDILKAYFYQLSILDWSEDPNGINYYFEKTSLADPGSCAKLTPITGFFPPPKSTFLSDINAVFAGWDWDQDYGLCQKWTFFLWQIYGNSPPVNATSTTVLTFWFNSNLEFIRWDLVGTELKTGVQTWYYNCQNNVQFIGQIFNTTCIQ